MFHLIKKSGSTILSASLCFFVTASFAVVQTSHQSAKTSAQPTTATVKKKSQTIQNDNTSSYSTLHPVPGLLDEQLQKLTQNRDNPMGEANWLSHFRLGGLLNVEAYDYTDPKFQAAGNNSQSQQISLATALLNVDAFVNDWINGHFGVFYSSTESRYYLTNKGQNNSATHGVIVDEAYVTIANFKSSPFYFRAGQQYLPFGAYQRYPISETLTQELSETRAVAGELGFNQVNGLTGALSLLDGLAKTGHSGPGLDNFIAALSYENRNHPVGVNLGVEHINNMTDVGSISYNIRNKTYVTRVGGVAAHLDLFTGAFDFDMRYVTALRRFSTTDFSYQARPGHMHGAKPSAAAFETGYTFQTYGHESRFDLSYQVSRESRNVNGSSTAMVLPRNRMSLGYGIQILKNTIVAAEVRRDHDYSRTHGGTNKYNNAGTIRLTVLV